jgi:hypothetical protein
MKRWHGMLLFTLYGEIAWHRTTQILWGDGTVHWYSIARLLGTLQHKFFQKMIWYIAIHTLWIDSVAQYNSHILSLAISIELKVILPWQDLIKLRSYCP